MSAQQQITIKPKPECDTLTPDEPDERLFWLGIRQGVLIILSSLEKYKLKINRRCKNCGIDL